MFHRLPESLALKSCQPRLERLAARVVEQQLGVDAEWSRKLHKFEEDRSLASLPGVIFSDSRWLDELIVSTPLRQS
jgi:hypothetical protein